MSAYPGPLRCLKRSSGHPLLDPLRFFFFVSFPFLIVDLDPFLLPAALEDGAVRLFKGGVERGFGVLLELEGQPRQVVIETGELFSTQPYGDLFEGFGKQKPIKADEGFQSFAP